MSGLIEGVAWRKRTGEYFFGDVRERCVWRRTTDGSVIRFTAADDRIFGVFGIAIDETRGALWVATSAVPEMRSYAPGQEGAAGLAEFDLATGELRRAVRVPPDGRNHVLGDLALAPDGAVFATDSVSPVLWRLPTGGDALEPFVQSDEFMSLQGVALTADARGLWLTAYGNGLLHVDLATREARRLTIPPSTTLLGCDGIARTTGDDLIVVQNGGTPTRILRVSPHADHTAVTHIRVLEAAHAIMADATLGCSAGSDFVFIADGGWRFFTKDAVAPNGLRAVPVLRVRLE
jgi:sugar lactone lactonase YvrE